MMNFSEKLKKLRNDKKMTQNELADAIYVSRSMIAKYESGLISPTKEIAEKLAAYFNVELLDLLESDESTQASLDTLKPIQPLHKIISITGVMICFIFLLISFIPMLRGYYYIIYPIPEGMEHPLKEYYTWSIVYACLKNGNPIAIITFIMCIADVLLFVKALYSLSSIITLLS